MINKAFDHINKDEIDSLLFNEVKEGRTVKYKLSGGADSEKKEFLGDVSSFANAAGGDLQTFDFDIGIDPYQARNARYLVLLSLYQSCTYKGGSFLEFLKSGGRDVDAFCERRKPRRSLPSGHQPGGRCCRRKPAGAAGRGSASSRFG